MHTHTIILCATPLSWLHSTFLISTSIVRTSTPSTFPLFFLFPLPSVVFVPLQLSKHARLLPPSIPTMSPLMGKERKERNSLVLRYIESAKLPPPTQYYFLLGVKHTVLPAAPKEEKWTCCSLARILSVLLHHTVVERRPFSPLVLLLLLSCMLSPE